MNTRGLGSQAARAGRAILFREGGGCHRVEWSSKLTCRMRLTARPRGLLHPWVYVLLEFNEDDQFHLAVTLEVVRCVGAMCLLRCQAFVHVGML